MRYSENLVEIFLGEDVSTGVKECIPKEERRRRQIDIHSSTCVLNIAGSMFLSSHLYIQNRLYVKLWMKASLLQLVRRPT